MKIEIEKPVVPRFVADWIELCKDGGINVYDAMTDNLSNSMMDWLFNEEKVDDFAKAWVIGYEVEKPLYYAKIKGWELIKGSHKYWNKVKHLTSPMLSRVVIYINTETAAYLSKLTKDEWNELGINDSNADFEEVGE